MARDRKNCKTTTLLHSAAFHSGQSPGLHWEISSGLLLGSHLFLPPLHMTARLREPLPHVTEHCKTINQLVDVQWDREERNTGQSRRPGDSQDISDLPSIFSRFNVLPLLRDFCSWIIALENRKIGIPEQQRDGRSIKWRYVVTRDTCIWHRFGPRVGFLTSKQPEQRPEMFSEDYPKSLPFLKYSPKDFSLRTSKLSQMVQEFS